MSITPAAAAPRSAPRAARHQGLDEFPAAILGAGVYTLTGYFAAGATSGGNVTLQRHVGRRVWKRRHNRLWRRTHVSPQQPARHGLCLRRLHGLHASSSDQQQPTKPRCRRPFDRRHGRWRVFCAGASNAIVSGAVYSPTGAFYMSGGASVGNGANGCLEIVANTVTLTGGTAAASSCITAVTGTSSSSSSAPPRSSNNRFEDRPDDGRSSTPRSRATKP